jgi:thiol-disulfide isomerase/thioredoxin
MIRTTTTTAALALVLALTLAGCASDDAETPAADTATSASAMAKEPTESAMATDDGEAMAKEDGDADAAMSADGAWIDQAAYDADAAAYHEAGDVVLFFNASWCPTCQATVKSLDADGAPAGLTVVSVDFDNSAELREKYGVTVQHTFVQVDEAGSELAKFTGSASGDEIAANTV